MVEFDVQAMSCAHRVGRARAAIAHPEAVVNVDLAAGHVSVDTPHAREPFNAALVAAGYPAR